jgi:hypothetical protein
LPECLYGVKCPVGTSPNKNTRNKQAAIKRPMKYQEPCILFVKFDAL